MAKPESHKVALIPADNSLNMASLLASTSVDKLISVVYVSSAAYLYNNTQLVAILKQARANNERDGISGMLLYRDGNFLQILEGPEAEVKQAMHRIEKDPRHRGILVLRTKPLEQRDFGDWQMGFRDISATSLKEIPGYSPFMELSFNSDEFRNNPSFAYRMLLQFKDKLR